MRGRNGSIKIVIAILLIVIIIAGIAFLFLLTKGDLRKLKTINVLSSNSTKITATIQLDGDKEITLPYQDEFVEPGFMAEDEKNGDITEKVEISKEEINENEYNMVYKVKDSSGNIVEEKRHITLIDEVPPVLNLNGNKNVYINIGEEYIDSGYVATDEKDGDLSANVEVEGTVDTSQKGLYILNYKVTDKSGNIATNERYVAVSEAGKVLAQDGTQGKPGVIYLTFDDGPTRKFYSSNIGYTR